MTSNGNEEGKEVTSPSMDPPFDPPNSPSPNIELIVSPTSDVVRKEVAPKVVVAPAKKSPTKRDKDLRSDPEKAEDLK